MAKKDAEKAASNVAEIASRATNVQKFTEVWIGSSPESLGMDSETEKVAMPDLVNQEIVILGYSKRTGDKGPWVICTFVPVGGSQAKIVVTGAAILVRKLDEVAAKDGFPVSGTIYSKPSKTTKGGHYFDFR